LIESKKKTAEKDRCWIITGIPPPYWGMFGCDPAENTYEDSRVVVCQSLMNRQLLTKAIPRRAESHPGCLR
jgi:hypothetical protein